MWQLFLICLLYGKRGEGAVTSLKTVEKVLCHCGKKCWGIWLFLIKWVPGRPCEVACNIRYRTFPHFWSFSTVITNVGLLATVGYLCIKFVKSQTFWTHTVKFSTPLSEFDPLYPANLLFCILISRKMNKKLCQKVIKTGILKIWRGGLGTFS